MTVSKSIDQFCRWFRKQLACIDSLQCADGMPAPPQYRTALYITAIDALAKVRYYDERLRNKRRFLRIIREHADWTECELVSVAVLRRRLGQANKSPLAQHLDEPLAPFEGDADGPKPPGGPYGIAKSDREVSDLLELARSEEVEMVKRARHVDLLYDLRNYLLHEIRPPGHAMEAIGDGGDEPFYHAYANQPGLELCYPAPFVRKLAYSVLDSLEEWLLGENVDPYTRVADSSSWRHR